MGPTGRSAGGENRRKARLFVDDGGKKERAQLSIRVFER